MSNEVWDSYLRSEYAKGEMKKIAMEDTESVEVEEGVVVEDVPESVKLENSNDEKKDNEKDEKEMYMKSQEKDEKEMYMESKAEVLTELVKIANFLDNRGLTTEADEIDSIIKDEMSIDE